MRKTLCAIVAAAFLFGGCGTGTDEKGSKKVADIYDVTPAAVKELDIKKKSLAFIIDTSGSMNDKLNGYKKIDSAKEALMQMLQKYKEHNDKDKDLEAGLFYFSSNNIVICAVPISPFDYEKISSAVKNLGTSGGTPLGAALAYAERELDRQGTGMSKSIVMLTDGENTVGEEPGKIFRKIKETNEKAQDAPTSLYLVAFNTKKEPFKQLEEIGAKVYEAKNAAELSSTLCNTADMILEALPEPAKK